MKATQFIKIEEKPYFRNYATVEIVEEFDSIAPGPSRNVNGTEYTISLNISRRLFIGEELARNRHIRGDLINDEAKAICHQLYGDLLADLFEVVSFARNAEAYEAADKALRITGKIIDSFDILKQRHEDRPKGM